MRIWVGFPFKIDYCADNFRYYPHHRDPMPSAVAPTPIEHRIKRFQELANTSWFRRYNRVLEEFQYCVYYKQKRAPDNIIEHIYSFSL